MFKFFYKKHRTVLLFHVQVNLCFLFCISLSSYTNIPLSGAKDHLIYGIHVLLLQFTVSGFIYLLTLNSWLFRIVFNSIFIVLSLFAFWVYTQDLSITKSLIQVVLESKPSIAIDLISLPYIVYASFIIFILIFINKKFNKITPIKPNILFLLIALFSISMFFMIEKIRFNTFRSRLPYSMYYGLNEYFKESGYVLKNVSSDVKSNVDKLQIVFVLGESVRADHLSINGYKRETTPLLEKRKNLISFKNIYTPHTYTSVSLPRILTDLSVKDDVITNPLSIYSVFNQCNYETHWVGNQELEKGYELIARSNNKITLIDSFRSVYSFNKALDEKLLKPFKSIILKPNQGLYTIHMMGSHWYYEKRYTDKFRTYNPVVDSKYIPSLKAEQLINSYDNTILYLDNFLDGLITTLEEKDSSIIMIYLSDHGEILGENGKWLHAQQSEASQNPAMLIWYSDKFQSRFPNKVESIYINKDKKYFTDFLFNSLLDAISIENFDYDKSQSIFQ